MMRNSIFVFFLAVTQVCFASSTDQYQTLIVQLDNIIKTHEVPSYSLSIVSTDENLLQHTSGLSDRRHNRTASNQTLYRIGSITKAFTSLAMLQLQERGMIHLDEPLKMYFPDAPIDNPWRTTHPVTIAQLLEHSAGLLDLSKREFDHNTPISLHDGVFFSGKRNLQWPAGLFHSYSNAGAGYAAYVLEQKTKRLYENYIRENLFLPLNMSTSTLLLDQKTKHNIATGYDSDGRTIIPYWHMLMRPFGAINSRAAEMGNFVRLLMNKGMFDGKRMLAETSIQRMETPMTTLAARAGLTYGYGLGNYQFISHGVLFHGHGGDGDGYLAHYAYSRELDRGYFIVINAFNHSALRKIRDRIEAVLTHGYKTSAVSIKPVPVDQAKNLEGVYINVTRRFAWQNADEGNEEKLFVRVLKNGVTIERNGDDSVRLYHVGDLKFRSEQDPVATHIFFKTKDQQFFIGETGNYRKQAD